jgi:hypothetical protein
MFSDVWYVFGILNLCVYAEQNFPQLVEPFCFAGNDKMQASKNGEQRASPAAPAAPLRFTAFEPDSKRLPRPRSPLGQWTSQCGLACRKWKSTAA